MAISHRLLGCFRAYNVLNYYVSDVVGTDMCPANVSTDAAQGQAEFKGSSCISAGAGRPARPSTCKPGVRGLITGRVAVQAMYPTAKQQHRVYQRQVHGPSPPKNSSGSEAWHPNSAAGCRAADHSSASSYLHAADAHGCRRAWRSTRPSRAAATATAAWRQGQPPKPPETGVPNVSDAGARPPSLPLLSILCRLLAGRGQRL